MKEKPAVLVIVGPTASGKSALAVRLAKKLNGEVISADSRQVYKGLDIGTGKITKKEMMGVKHHLLDLISSKKVFTANDYVKAGRMAMADIQKRGKTATICGGTGFYVDALLGNISLSGIPPNKKLRTQLQSKSVLQLFSILMKKNPARARKMNHSDKNNPVRLIRAIEISAQQRPSLPLKKIEAIWIGINPDMDDLQKKVHARLLARMKIGMVKEAEELHRAGLSWKRMEELGLEYRYLALYLQGKLTKAEMLEQLETKIMQYAKRQMTYWKRNKDIKWFSNATAAEAWMKSKFYRILSRKGPIHGSRRGPAFEKNES